MKEKERQTEANRGTELSTINGIVVRNNIGAVDAASLNGMVRICIEYWVQVFRPNTHCSSLFFTCFCL